MSNFKGWESYQAKPAASKPQTSTTRMQALGRLPGSEMNKTEAAYNRLLETRLGTGEIRWFKFEPINIRLGAKCFYSVDFMVMLYDGTLEAHEVKGFWQDDALAKFKAAAATMPFKFKAVRMTKGNFETILEI